MDPVPFLFLFFAILIRWNLTLVDRDLALDVCFIWFQVMYMDVVPDVFIWMVNWAHCLNYEVIPCSSSTCQLSVHGTFLGQTVASYIWCNGIPRVVPVFSLFSECIRI